MSEERSPLLDVIGDVPEVAQPDATGLELSVISSSFEDSSGGEGLAKMLRSKLKSLWLWIRASLREAMILGSRPSLWAVSCNWKR
jgi:hypothetical protein